FGANPRSPLDASRPTLPRGDESFPVRPLPLSQPPSPRGDSAPLAALARTGCPARAQTPGHFPSRCQALPAKNLSVLSLGFPCMLRELLAPRPRLPHAPVPLARPPNPPPAGMPALLATTSPPVAPRGPRCFQDAPVPQRFGKTPSPNAAVESRPHAP